MRVTFVGVGEAFDETLANTSLLVESGEGEGKSAVLCDCGFTAAAAFFACPSLAPALRETGPAALWISHFHGDHCFGLPYLLARWQEAGRRAPLAVHGGPGAAEKVPALLDLAYPNLRAKLGFAVQVRETRPGETFDLAGFSARTAPTGHGAPCLALRLEASGKALYYSGDGDPTPDCFALASGCDLVVQEAYGITAGVPGHGSVEEALALAGRAEAKRLAVVHVRREVRRERAGEIRARLAAAGQAAGLPEPGTVIAP